MMITSNGINSNPNKKKKSTNGRVYFWSSECKYPVIFERVRQLGWKQITDEKLENKVNVIWVDVATIHEHFRTIQPWQMINHFPGMPNIARKNRMGQNLNKMLKIFPKEYSFYPRTWILPGEMADFRQQFDSNGNSLGNKIYIIKPDTGCQGRGIFLTRTFENVPTQENVVAQLYIKKPLLLDGFKFDLRLYCLVSSVRPLRMYLFHDGLVRMCTEEYVKPTKQNINNVCMNLTNYAVNKHNENFQQPSAASSEESQDGGHKRSLLWFMNYVRLVLVLKSNNYYINHCYVIEKNTVILKLTGFGNEWEFYALEQSYLYCQYYQENMSNTSNRLIMSQLILKRSLYQVT